MSRIDEVGILFSDIAGSSRLYEAVGNAAALSIIETCYSMQTSIIAQYGGKIIKTIGDEVMAAFADAAGMFDAAVEMQQAAERLAASQPRSCVHLHIGFYFGPVLNVGGDYFGETVNTAAHLTRIAKAQQIVTAQEVMDRLDWRRHLAVRDLDYFPVKGRSGGLHAVEVLWDETADRTLFSPGRVIAPRAAHSLLKLEHCGVECVYDGRRMIAIGRDPASDIVVSSTATSRKHAWVELRGDKWILADRSANGTFVIMESFDVLHLHCEEIILHASGMIGLGQHPVPSVTGCVRFMLQPI